MSSYNRFSGCKSTPQLSINSIKQLSIYDAAFWGTDLKGQGQIGPA